MGAFRIPEHQAGASASWRRGLGSSGRLRTMKTSRMRTLPLKLSACAMKSHGMSGSVAPCRVKLTQHGPLPPRFTHVFGSFEYSVQLLHWGVHSTDCREMRQIYINMIVDIALYVSRCVYLPGQALRRYPSVSSFLQTFTHTVTSHTETQLLQNA